MPGDGQRTQPCPNPRVTTTCDLRPFLHFGPNSRRSLAGECSSAIWNNTCCIWNTKVETDALSWFNSTAMLTHNLFQIWVKRSSSTIQPVWAVSQWLKGQEVVHEQKQFMNTHVYVQPVKVRGSKESSWTEVVYELSHTFSTKSGAESKYFRNSV